jgi:enoyl-CoA hydratase/carnithine racemase
MLRTSSGRSVTHTGNPATTRGDGRPAAAAAASRAGRAKIDAATALQLGLACRVVPDDKVMDEATALAHRLTKLPAAALRATKRALNMHLERASIGILDYACAAEAETFTLPDLQEKLAAMRKGRS